MPPTSTQQVLLSPAELSYLHTSLSLTPPIRPDGRTSTQFRPLIAETDILPSTNGSARICFADGTEAIVGVKAEVEKSPRTYGVTVPTEELGRRVEADEDDADADDRAPQGDAFGEDSWVDITVEIPGFRDDDSMPVFLAALLSEALLADGEFSRRLWINTRFHWKLYIDVCFDYSHIWLPPILNLLDITPLTTTIISTSAFVSHYASGAALYAITEAKIRARRRSSLRRRLGCFGFLVSSRKGRQRTFKTTGHTVSHVRRRQHSI